MPLGIYHSVSTEPDIEPDADGWFVSLKSTHLDRLSSMHGGGIGTSVELFLADTCTSADLASFSSFAAFDVRVCENRACMRSDLESIEPLKICSRCHEVF